MGSRGIGREGVGRSTGARENSNSGDLFNGFSVLGNRSSLSPAGLPAADCLLKPPFFAQA